MIKANGACSRSDGEVHTAVKKRLLLLENCYPVMLKASRGGKGIRKVEKAEDLVSAF